MNLNVTSAAEACKVRRELIEKALKEDRFPGAFYSGESKRGGGPGTVAISMAWR